MIFPTPTTRQAMRNPPRTPLVGYQRWSQLLFLHWRVDPETIQATLPTGLYVDTFEGKAYLGVVPFFMERIRPRFLPPLPWLSWFLELNVRTYVHDEQGRPGVWFYSLDCNQPLAVALAQRFFHLPYFNADMKASLRPSEKGLLIDYHCRRASERECGHFSWQEAQTFHQAETGSLEFFLVERYALFAQSKQGLLYEGMVHHRPYEVAQAQVMAWSTAPLHLAGFAISEAPFSCLCSRGVDVSIHGLRPCLVNR